MKSNYKDIVPAVPPSFFSSLTIEQQKELRRILTAYRLHYSTYYSFSGEIIRRESFIFSLWRVRLYKEVIEPAKITNEMFHLLSIVYYLGISPRYKDTRITKQVIIDIVKGMGYCGLTRLFPQQNLRYLVKYEWLSIHRLRNNKAQYFITQKGRDIMIKYSLQFTELFNSFFESLSL